MSLVINTTVIFFIDRFGRRPILHFSTVGMLVGFVIWTILSARYAIEEYPSAHLGRGVVGFIFFYNFFYNIKSGLPLAYTIEIMPYGLRAKGQAVYAFTSMVTVFFNQFINPIALEAIQLKYYIFYCCFLVFEIWFLYTYVAETRYVPIEEISKFFDEETANVSGLAKEQLQEAENASTVLEVEHKRQDDKMPV